MSTLAKVRILSARLGFAAGQIVEMSDAAAAGWLARGDAEWVERVPQRSEPIETAVASPVETAVRHSRRRRG